jgi:hypothetical protein
MRIGILAGACALTALVSHVSGATVFYSNKAAWLSDLAARGQSVGSLSLAPQTLTRAAQTVTDDEVSIAFDSVPTFDSPNSVQATGWTADLWGTPPFPGVSFTVATFTAPITAFGATVMVQANGTTDSLAIQGHVIDRTTYQNFGPAFFGFIADAPVASVNFIPLANAMYYTVSNVQYAATAAVPLPPALWAGLPLLGLCLIIHRRRSAAFHRASAR